MASLAASAAPPLMDPIGRSFALLDQAELSRLRPPLRPLPWIDGLLTALVVAPDTAEHTGPDMGQDMGQDRGPASLWADYIWNADSLEAGSLTPPQTGEIIAWVTDHLCHITACLLDDPEVYRPYLGGYVDALEAASQWAAGFCCGINLSPSSWAAALADEDAASLLVAVFCLVREGDLVQRLGGESPFAGMPPARREHMRRAALEMLPDIVRALHDDTIVRVEDDSRDGKRKARAAEPRFTSPSTRTSPQ